MRIIADNCGACGGEFSSNELTKISLGSYFCDLHICNSCLNVKKIAEDFCEAAELISTSFENKK